MGLQNTNTSTMILIIDVGYTAIYKLEDLVDQYIDFKTIPIFDINIEELKELKPKGIIISHAHFSIHEQDYSKFTEVLQPLLELNLPMLGIGVGQHLLGVCYGASPGYAPYRHDLVEIGILEDDELLDKLPDVFEMIKDNAGTVSIPPKFKLLANSDYSINEVMRKEDAPVYGVQFLLENSGNYGGIIMDNFVNILTKEES